MPWETSRRAPARSLKGRIHIVAPPEKDAGELIGQTVGVRFREKRDGTTYFLLKVLAVNWKEGGPVPAITADLPGTKGGPPVRSLVTPKDMQQFVLFGAMDPEERNLRDGRLGKGPARRAGRRTLPRVGGGRPQADPLTWSVAASSSTCGPAPAPTESRRQSRHPSRRQGVGISGPPWIFSGNPMK